MKLRANEKKRGTGDMFSISDMLLFFSAYLFGLGVMYLLLFLLACIPIVCWPPRKTQVSLKRIQKLGLFLFLLLIAGATAGYIWFLFIWNHCYVGGDDIGLDFLPFEPVSQAWLDHDFEGTRHLANVTLWQLQLIWLLFAAGTWGITIVAYRFISRKLV